MVSPEIEKMLGQYPEGSLLEIATARAQSDGQESFAFAQLMVTRKDLGTARQEKKFDYGNFILERVNIEYREARSEIEALIAGRAWSLGRLERFGPFGLSSDPRYVFIQSNWPHSSLRFGWPYRYLEFTCKQELRANPTNRTLFGSGLPVYPNEDEAIKQFFELGVGPSHGFGQYGMLKVIFPDYRARIQELRIGYRSITVKPQAVDLPVDSLIAKIYAENDETSASSEDLHFADGGASFSIPFDPRRVIAILLDKMDGQRIDEGDYYLGTSLRQGVVIDRPEQQIRELIANGEDKHVEFKGTLNNETKDDFLESVVAFANTEGGIILLGINNNRVPIGYIGDTEDILKRIRDSCEPLIEPQFRKYNLDGHDMVAVEVTSGPDKPYMLKYKGVIYVRIGPNDIPASRLDLDQILRNRENQNPTGILR